MPGMIFFVFRTAAVFFPAANCCWGHRHTRTDTAAAADAAATAVTACLYHTFTTINNRTHHFLPKYSYPFI